MDEKKYPNRFRQSLIPKNSAKQKIARPMRRRNDRGRMTRRRGTTPDFGQKHRNRQATGLAPGASTLAESCPRLLFQMSLDAFHRETWHGREKLAPEMCVDTPRPFCYSTRFALCARNPRGSFPVRLGRALRTISAKYDDLEAVCPGGTQAQTGEQN